MHDPAVVPEESIVGAETAALPVVLHLGGRHADAVRRWVEGVLGWQPIDGATAGLVPPAVELRDLGATPPVTTGSRLPCVLLVDDDARPLDVAHMTLGAPVDEVIGWPSGRDQLAEVVGRLVSRPRSDAGGLRVLRIGGSAGGVGTTTVALALAGLSGWSGARSLAAVRGSGLSLRGIPAAALAGSDVWAQADELPGVARARAVRLTDVVAPPDPIDGRIDVAVLDLGVRDDVDVLVCRPDAAALAALPRTTAAAVVVVGEGPARIADLRRAAEGRRAIALPWSVRVARAGLTGRVPAGLPGAWLRRLVPLAPLARPSAVHASSIGSAGFD
jgi:hypothetical protein